MLEAHKNIHQFQGQTEPEMAAWLGRILNNNMMDAVRAMRRQKRDVSREQSLENDRFGGEHNAADRVGSEQTTPSLCAVRAEDLNQLHEALSQLPDGQQQVITLHHLQGQSLAETSEKLGRSQAAVAGLLFRGLKKLRRVSFR